MKSEGSGSGFQPRFKKYFQPAERDTDWGAYILGCGDYSSLKIEMPDQGRVLKDYALVYFTEGEGLFYTGEEQAMHWMAGDILMLFPDVWHKYTSKPDSPSKQYWIIFNGSHIRHLHDKSFITESAPLLRGGFDTELHSIIKSIESRAEKEAPYFQLEAGSDLIRLLARIIKLSDSSLSVQINDAVRRTIEKIGDDCRSIPDFEQEARDGGLSYVHYRRLFKKATGMSPHQYHLSVRINRAKMLLDSNMSVKETAYELGFSCQYHFSRVFKEKTGTSPSEWTSL